MAEYVYKTNLYYETDDVAGVPASNTADVSDFESNHQSSVVNVDEITFAETSFLMTKSYEDFDDLITTPYDWGDVKCVTDHNSYKLYLITGSPL
jgi:hypothetical protein